MAIPTPVNGQITDALTTANTKGGEAALSSITELLGSIASSLHAAQGGSSLSKADIAKTLSSAFAKSESELQEILSKL